MGLWNGISKRISIKKCHARLKALAEERVGIQERIWMKDAEERVAAQEKAWMKDAEERVAVQEKAWMTGAEERVAAQGKIWMKEARAEAKMTAWIAAKTGALMKNAHTGSGAYIEARELAISEAKTLAEAKAVVSACRRALAEAKADESVWVALDRGERTFAISGARALVGAERKVLDKAMAKMRTLTARHTKG